MSALGVHTAKKLQMRLTFVAPRHLRQGDGRQGGAAGRVLGSCKFQRLSKLANWMLCMTQGFSVHEILSFLEHPENGSGLLSPPSHLHRVGSGCLLGALSLPSENSGQDEEHQAVRRGSAGPPAVGLGKSRLLSGSRSSAL